MRIKKKGSALLTVILVFAILITVGSAVMTVSISDVKMRTNESKRVKNLYGSESGLEKAYGILSQYIDDAIKGGNTKVNDYLGSLNSENGILFIERQKLMNGESYNEDLIGKDGNIKEDYIKSKINSLFKEGYKITLTDKIKNVLVSSEGIVLGTKSSSPKVVFKNLKLEDVVFTKSNININEPEELKVVLGSTYEQLDSNGLKNLREVESTFKIFVPEYDAPYSMKTEKISLQENIIRGKTLVTNSNLELMNSSNLNIKGEVFVLGNTTNVNNETGILITGHSGKLNLSDANVISKGDTKIKGASSSIISNDKSVIYTGSLSIDKSAQNSKVDLLGSVYANNDLILNGEKSSINIAKGFYGVNDIRKTTIGEKTKNSSSIIVNAKDIGETNGSSINIGNELVLLGTAYIDTKPESYQTGESVAIKGNYKAYTSALDNAGNYNKENIVFDYLSPLQLANRFNNGEKLNIKDKDNYFMAFYKNDDKRNTLKFSGINLPQYIYTLGVYINNNSAYGGNYSIDNDVIKNSIKTYEDKIKEIDSVNDYINYSAITSTINEVTTYEGAKEVVYLSRENSNLLISNGNGTSSGNNIYLNGTKAKGIVIASGDVYIDGDVNFEGTIISNGRIIINDNAKVTLNSNKKIVDYIVAKNYNKFTGIFKNDTVNAVNNFEIDAEAVIANSLQSIPKENLIKNSNWKLIK